ncbi:hypothetical protein BXY64_1747 [Marinifilum flexuosum]|uniref:Uncharacterized protein n=1 Tax=Marinifilum flexuosum TaxID=1117708 RepID=A0A419XAW5_9BACT|nr:hypothetical protein BXY64_1747 [Marinifilum flexuosum]
MAVKKNLTDPYYTNKINGLIASSLTIMGMVK